MFDIVEVSTGKTVGSMTTDENGYAKSDTLVYSDAGFDVIEKSVPEDLPVVRNTEPVLVTPEAGKVGAVNFHNKAMLDPLQLEIRKRKYVR